MKQPRNTLKTYFQKGKKPTEEQFSNTLDSFVHKDDSVSIDNVEGLRGSLDSKLDRGAESELIKVFDEKLEEAKNTVNKAYLGIAVPASTAPPIGSFWFRVESGNIATFQNLKDSGGNPIITIAEDFEKDGAFYDVTIEITNGVAKKELSQKASSTTPKWSNKPFNKGSQVFHEGCIWEANAITTGTDIPGVSDRWDIKLIGFNISESNDLFQFASKNGVDLFHVDKDGYFYAMYYPNSIPAEAVTGLLDFMTDVEKGYFKVLAQNSLLSIQDSDHKILENIEPVGSVYIPSLRVDDLDYHPSDMSSTYSDVFEGTNFVISDPGLLTLDFSVLFPIDAGITNSGTVKFMSGNNVLLTARCAVSVQGMGSASYFKKGFTVDLQNKVGGKLKVKIGDLPALDSYHMKAYFTDGSKSKDIFGGRLWRQLIANRPYPENMHKPVTTQISPTFDQTRFSPDAVFALDGYPCDVYQNGSYRGQYVFRLKKDKSVYAIDTANKNHILLDSQVYGVGLGAKEYPDFNAIAVDYENRSPKSVDQNVKNNMVRFFQYMRDIYTGAKVFTGTYQDYIVFNAWADFLLLAEVTGHWDTMTNNAMYITYDGKIWQPCPIDMDAILGMGNGTIQAPGPGWVMGNKDIWPKFRTQFNTQLRERYTYLRQNTLKKENLCALLKSISNKWPASSYEKEFYKWGLSSMPGAVDTLDNAINFMSVRVDWLDTQLKN